MRLTFGITFIGPKKLKEHPGIIGVKFGQHDNYDSMFWFSRRELSLKFSICCIGIISIHGQKCPPPRNIQILWINCETSLPTLSVSDPTSFEMRTSGERYRAPWTTNLMFVVLQSSVISGCSPWSPSFADSNWTKVDRFSQNAKVVSTRPMRRTSSCGSRIVSLNISSLSNI